MTTWLVNALTAKDDPLPLIRGMRYAGLPPVGTGKGKTMGRRRSNNLQSRNRAMIGVFGPPILVFVLLVAGIYIYEQKYNDSGSAYDRAISDCVRDHTRVATSSVVQEQATSDCVRDTAPDGR